MVVLVEDEDPDVDIGVEGRGAQVKSSHSHIVHLVPLAFISDCARKIINPKEGDARSTFSGPFPGMSS